MSRYINFYFKENDEYTMIGTFSGEHAVNICEMFYVEYGEYVELTRDDLLYILGQCDEHIDKLNRAVNRNRDIKTTLMLSNVSDVDKMCDTFIDLDASYNSLLEDTHIYTGYKMFIDNLVECVDLSDSTSKLYFYAT